MAALNFHHLRYFHAIAQAGGLTRAAVRLNVSPSALSIQLAQLETSLGQKLFDRTGRSLTLTEAGRIALDRAGAIFAAGDELVATLKGHGGQAQGVLRIGALATLSRNFQVNFLRPLAGRADVRIVLRSASLRELLQLLAAHQLDLVLANTLPPRDAATAWVAHLIADQPVSLVGRPTRRRRRALAALLAEAPLILPTLETTLRGEFDALTERLGVFPRIAAEVDDMAMLRLLAREGAGLAVVPPIVVQDELAARRLVEAAQLPGLHERFYAITPSRRFPNPLVAGLLRAAKGNGR
jgi:LysR family transcriptional activator of nhaA